MGLRGAAFSEAVRRDILEEVTCERNPRGRKETAMQTADRAPSGQREPQVQRSGGTVCLAGRRGRRKTGE